MIFQQSYRKEWIMRRTVVLLRSWSGLVAVQAHGSGRYLPHQGRAPLTCRRISSFCRRRRRMARHSLKIARAIRITIVTINRVNQPPLHGPLLSGHSSGSFTPRLRRNLLSWVVSPSFDSFFPSAGHAFQQSKSGFRK